MRDKAFKIDRSNFNKVFKERCFKAGIPKELAHPHILRHTRAIEFLIAGVPVIIVQDLLGHSALTTTAIYLKISVQEAKGILREKGAYTKSGTVSAVPLFSAACGLVVGK